MQCETGRVKSQSRVAKPKGPVVSFRFRRPMGPSAQAGRSWGGHAKCAGPGEVATRSAFEPSINYRVMYL